MLCGVNWRLLVYVSVVWAGDSVYTSVVLAGDCWCMFQWFGLETVSVYFSGVGWRLSASAVVLAGVCVVDQ